MAVYDSAEQLKPVGFAGLSSFMRDRLMHDSANHACPARPLIDITNGHTGDSLEEKQKIVSQLANACHSRDFVFVINHLLPHEKLRGTFALSREIFDLEQKQRLLPPHLPDHVVHRGYS